MNLNQKKRWVLVLLGVIGILLEVSADDTVSGDLEIEVEDSKIELRISGEKDDAWVFESSDDLINWEEMEALGTVNSDDDAVSIDAEAGSRFFRARSIPGFYNPLFLRTIEISFAESDWRTILTENYADASLHEGDVMMDGVSYPDVGIRYKGNTSFTNSGDKKSIAIDTDYEDADLEIMGFENFNFNNAFNDESLMREALFFNSIKEYAIAPNAGFIKIVINGENWGVYSNAQQQDKTLLEEWFDDYDGDRWKAPSGTGAGGGDTGGGGGGGGPGGGGGGGGPGGGGGGGGGGGNFVSGDKALLYLGDDPATYMAQYELKTEKTDDPWGHLIAAAKLLDETDPTAAGYREIMETLFAVDEWLWLIAAEVIFTDDDSYWHKGADYQIYFDPESGRLHPIEHDGNEAFTVGDETLDPLTEIDNPNRPIMHKFFSNPELKQRYLAHVRTILDERFNSEYLGGLIDQYRPIIEVEVLLDDKKGFSNGLFSSDIATLKSHIQERYSYLRSHAEVGLAGPVIESVSLLEIPDAAAPGKIVATVSQHASEGVSAVRLYFRQGDVGGYTDVEMLDDGLHSDGLADDGVYGGDTAGFLAGQKIRYYVEAVSGNAHNTVSYYPARAESGPLRFEVTASVSEGPSPVVINEFMASNDTALADPQGDFDDWIELKNVTNEALDVSGMYLSDNAGNPRKWTIPDGTFIPANGFLIVWADEDGEDTEGLHANFKLSASGEEILILDTDENANVILDHIIFGAQGADQSYGRLPGDTDQFGILDPTPGLAN